MSKMDPVELNPKIHGLRHKPITKGGPKLTVIARRYPKGTIFDDSLAKYDQILSKYGLVP